MHERSVDLHTHTNASDGDLSPVQLIQQAKRTGLSAISITDHDTVAAYTPATLQAAEQVGLELVPGIEISTQDERKKSYHVLGLLIDTGHAALRQHLETMRSERQEYTGKVVDLIRSELDLMVDDESLFSSGDTITKGNIARVVISDPRNEKSLDTMFGSIPTEGRFIQITMLEGQPCYVEKPIVTPSQAIDIVHDANGLAVLAHPGVNVMEGEGMEELCERLINWGGDGIEAINIQPGGESGDVDVDYTDRFIDLAAKYDLLVTGGSDFHTDSPSFGPHVDLGFSNYPHRGVPYHLLENLKERAQSTT